MTARPCSSTLHTGPRAERPRAGYTLHALPCQTETCRDALLCIGHGLCPECVAAVRSAAVVWTATGEDVEVVMVASR